MKLHLGCSLKYPGLLEGWENLDIHSWSDKIVQHDLRKPLPYHQNSIVAIYSCHTLEHLTKQDGLSLLKECHRVLHPCGVIRIIVPDLCDILESFHTFDEELTKRKYPLAHNKVSRLDWVVRSLYDADSKSGQHRYMYHRGSLHDALAAASFVSIKETKHTNSSSQYKVFQGIESFPNHSLAMEAKK